MAMLEAHMRASVCVQTWSDRGNTLGQDCDIYSTFTEAKTGSHPWQKCE